MKRPAIRPVPRREALFRTRRSEGRPYLKLDNLAIDINGFDLEINTNGGNEGTDEFLGGVLHQKAGLTDTWREEGQE